MHVLGPGERDHGDDTVIQRPACAGGAELAFLPAALQSPASRGRWREDQGPGSGGTQSRERRWGGKAPPQPPLLSSAFAWPAASGQPRDELRFQSSCARVLGPPLTGGATSRKPVTVSASADCLLKDQGGNGTCASELVQGTKRRTRGVPGTALGTRTPSNVLAVLILLLLPHKHEGESESGPRLQGERAGLQEGWSGCLCSEVSWLWPGTTSNQLGSLLDGTRWTPAPSTP